MKKKLKTKKMPSKRCAIYPEWLLSPLSPSFLSISESQNAIMLNNAKHAAGHFFPYLAWLTTTPSQWRSSPVWITFWSTVHSWGMGAWEVGKDDCVALFSCGFCILYPKHSSVNHFLRTKLRRASSLGQRKGPLPNKADNHLPRYWQYSWHQRTRTKHAEEQ